MKKKKQKIDLSIRRAEHAPSPHVLDLVARELLAETPAAKNFDDQKSSLPETVRRSNFKGKRASLSGHLSDLGTGLRPHAPSAIEHRLIHPMKPKTVSASVRHFFVFQGILLFARGVKILADGANGFFENLSGQAAVSVKRAATNIFAFPVPKFAFAIPLNSRRVIASFVALSFIFSAPLHALTGYGETRASREKIATHAEAAMRHLSLGGAMLSDLEAAQKEFKDAAKQFRLAQAEWESIGRAANFLAKFLPTDAGRQARSASRLLTVGEQLSRAAFSLAGSLNIADTKQFPSEKIYTLTNTLDEVLPVLKQAVLNLKYVEAGSFSAAQAEKIILLQTNLPETIKNLEILNGALKLAVSLLGDKEPRRYLLLFENNAEIRPTGGFIGSIAEIDLHRGVVKNLRIPAGGSYDLQGALLPLVSAPAPLQLVSARWQFHDGNWFPDFPASARKLMWFYEKSGQSSVDGVLAVTATFIEELLKVFGPIEMPEYGRIITAENFSLETQKIVEIEYDREENKPKQFIADLAPRLLKLLQNADTGQLLAVGRVLSDSLLQKHLLIYSKDENLEQYILERGWGGAIEPSDGDYLAVINTNIAGGKTDGVIDETIEHHTRINSDGSMIDTVVVTRAHRGQKGELFTGVRNVDYVRLYVPRGSELLEARGFSIPDSSLFDVVPPEYAEDKDLKSIEEFVGTDSQSGTRITNEFGKTVFGNWVQVDPGQTATYTVSYRLPFKLNVLKNKNTPTRASYSFLAQKQAGGTRTKFLHDIDFASGFSLLWENAVAPQKISRSQKHELMSDEFYGALFSIENSK